MPATPDPRRYGRRKVTKMYAEWNRMREVCRAEGTPAIQDALDDCEEWIDFAFQRSLEARGKA